MLGIVPDDMQDTALGPTDEQRRKLTMLAATQPKAPVGIQPAQPIPSTSETLGIPNMLGGGKMPPGIPATPPSIFGPSSTSVARPAQPMPPNIAGGSKMPSGIPATPPAGLLPTDNSLGPAPTRDLYMPQPMSRGKRIASALFAGMGAFKSPELGQQIYNEEFVQPQQEGEKQYEQAQNQYDKRAEQQRQNTLDQSELGLRAAQTGEIQARTAAIQNPPQKEGEWQPVTGTNLEVNKRTGESRPIQGMQPPSPKESLTPHPGMVNGKPTWGILTKQGWKDPNTDQPIPNFEPQPSFAETGLYEPTEMTVPGGGMQPGAFNRRTGTLSPIKNTGGAQIVPPAGQKEINSDLATARNIDRLESAQKQLLAGVEKRGQRGPAGGGPYLNGPESMQFVSNHIAMTFGAVKGARVGRDLIEAHIKARDLDQSTEALAQRVLSGGVITYSQAQQMMGTADINRRTVWQQARQAAEQYGVPDAVKLPSDLQQSAGDTGGGFKVNDTIVQNGVTFKVTKVDKNGKPLAASPAPNQ